MHGNAIDGALRTPLRKLGVRRDIGAIGQIRLVSCNQMAVLRGDQVRFNEVSAHRYRGLIGL